MNSVRPVWFYTYVLKSERDNEFYTGAAVDLRRRLKQHKEGFVSSTCDRRPLKLIYFEACLNEKDAFRRKIFEIRNGVSDISGIV